MRCKRSFFTALFLCLSALLLPVSIYAADDIKIVVDGKTLQLDQPAEMLDGRVMVPARAIFEELGFSVIYDPMEPELFKAYRNNATSDMYIEVALDGLETRNHHIFVEYDEYDRKEGLKTVGNREFITFGVICEVAPAIINGRTLLPARAISEACGATVDWNANTRTVNIDTANPVFYATYPTEGYFYPTRYHGYITENKNRTTAAEQGEPAAPVQEPAVIQQEPETTTSSDSAVKSKAIEPTAPPVVGSTPGNIVKDPNNIDYSVPMINNLTEPYIGPSVGECAWYVTGRFHEVHGISTLELMLGAGGKWIDRLSQMDVDYLEIVTDLNDIVPYSVGVYKDYKDNDKGHVVFIEYIERDGNGNPTYVYYTDANAENDINKGAFDYGVDGIVKKMDFEKFKARTTQYLQGYIRLK